MLSPSLVAGEKIKTGASRGEKNNIPRNSFFTSCMYCFFKCFKSGTGQGIFQIFFDSCPCMTIDERMFDFIRIFCNAGKMFVVLGDKDIENYQIDNGECCNVIVAAPIFIENSEGEPT